jgi:hypothetical protein
MWVGNVAWAVIALQWLYESGIHGNPAILAQSIDRGADWIVSQVGRIDDHPGLISVGLEGDISAYFGLKAAGRNVAAQDLGSSIYQAGWDPIEARLKMGAVTWSFGTAMDTAGSWGASLLRCLGRQDEALSSMGYAASVLPTTSFDSSNPAGRLVEGYGDIAGPWTMTVEFGAQGAAAGMLDADHIMREIYALEDDDGAFPGSTDNWFGGIVPPWTTTMTGVAPTAWVYFAQNGDPLLSICAEDDSDPLPVPSMSFWGIVALGSVLQALMLLHLRRRRTTGFVDLLQETRN